MMEKSLINEKCRAAGLNARAVIEAVREASVKAGRGPDGVRLLAATKTVEPQVIKAAIESGVTLIGENREQELTAKYDELAATGVEQHFIGHLQTNKVRRVVGRVSMIESVDSYRLAQEIDKVGRNLGLTTDILVEVNIGGEESKSGVRPDSLVPLLEEISRLSNVRVRGLMTIPPAVPSDEKKREFFSKMRKLFIDTADKKLDNISMDFLSMGMSDDYLIAIEEGANIVRVGSAIFGARKLKEE